MSAFARWFRAQHGERESTPDTDLELHVRVTAGELARAELSRGHEWDVRQTSALYAWQIRDADKPTAGS